MERKFSYEEKSEVIDTALKKRVRQWHLYAISWLDYDDVCQLIRTHIFVKWDLWDQARPLEPWINRIITNKIYNLLRDNYSSFARPCINCKHNQSTERETGQDDSLCSLTKSGTQSDECDLFAKWQKTRMHAYNVKIPVSLEFHAHERHTSPEDHLCIDDAAKRLHSEMRKSLSSKHFFIYKMLFIDGLTDPEVARILGYKSSEPGRGHGYKSLKNLRNSYKKVAREIVENEDLFF